MPGYNTQNRSTTWAPSCNVGPEPVVALGDEVLLCIFLSTVPPRKMIFKVKVEEYASLVLKGAEKLVFPPHSKKRMLETPIYTWVSASHLEHHGNAFPLNCADSSDMEARGHLVSCPQIFATEQLIAPMLNIIVNLWDGKIHSFAWDYGCLACGPTSCVQSSMSLENGRPSNDIFEAGVCARDSAGCEVDKSCDLKLYVTWAGTDRNGLHARSANMRLSRFQGSTIRSMWETASYKYDNTV